MKIKFNNDNKKGNYIKCNGGVTVEDDNGNDITSGLTDIVIVARANDVVRATLTYVVNEVSEVDAKAEDHIDITDMESLALEAVKNDIYD